MKRRLVVAAQLSRKFVNGGSEFPDCARKRRLVSVVVPEPARGFFRELPGLLCVTLYVSV